MGEVRYMISEASKRVNVEAHVMRHWEEELGLNIGRTEMGHRYYTEEDVRLFNCIKELKEQGMLLKAAMTVLEKLIWKKYILILNCLFSMCSEVWKEKE